MNETELLEVEAALARLAAAIGAPEVMDWNLYRELIPERGIRSERGRADRPLPTRSRIAEEIKALERHLSLFDRAVYLSSMERINKVLVGSGRDGETDFPKEAVILFDDEDRREGPTVSLATLPDLSEARRALRSLAEAIGEA